MIERFVPRAVFLLPLAAVAALGACSGIPATVSEAGSGGAATLGTANPESRVSSESALDGDVRQALVRSLPFLYSEGRAWMDGRVSVQEGSACVSCHHVGYAVWSHAEARRGGLDAGGEEVRLLDSEAAAFLLRPSVARALSVGPYLLAHDRPDAALIDALVELQTESGAWEAKGQFPTQRRTVEESNAVATLYSVGAIERAERSASVPEEAAAVWREAREKGIAWLRKAEPGSSAEWLAVSLAFDGAGTEGERAAALRTELEARQGADGGWGWLAGDESDAFSTGLAVYALALADGASDEAVARGAEFLVASQEDDGTWRVPSSAISREPSADKDLIYHYWGTAWAALGLARSLEAGEGVSSAGSLPSG